MLRTMLCLIAIVPAALVAAQAPVSAPAPPEPRISEAIEVPAINLEVFVTDAYGHTVADLKREEFRLYEDGEPVAFDLFQTPAVADIAGRRTGSWSRAEAPPAAAGSPVSLVVFIDEHHPSSGSRQLLLLDLARWARESLPRDSRVMILSYEGATRIVLPLSSDRGAIDAAFETAANYISPRRLLGDRDDREILELIQLDAQQGPCLNGLEFARQHAAQRRAEAETTIHALSRVVDTLEAIPGRKLVLYVGDGVSLRPGQEALEYYIEICSGTGVQQGLPEAQDTSTFGDVRLHRPDPTTARNELATLDTSSQWRRLAARANGQGVAIYSLTASTVPMLDRTGAESMRRTASPTTHAFAGQDRWATLQLIADETGARMLRGGPQPDEELARLGEDLTSYYLLGFAPAQPEDSRVRSLKVEMTRPGLRVRHRQSYAVKGAAEWGSDRLLAHLLYGVGENSLGLKLESPSASEPAAATRLRLRVPLGQLAFLPAGGEREGRFTAYLVARDESGATTPVRFKSFPVKVDEANAAADLSRDFTWEVEIDLAPGRHEVAAAVRDEVSGEIAYVSLAVQRSQSATASRRP